MSHQISHQISRPTSLTLNSPWPKLGTTRLGVQNYRILAFKLNEAGTYEPCTESQVLPGLPIDLLAQTIGHLKTLTNTAAANWFRQQIITLR